MSEADGSPITMSGSAQLGLSRYRLSESWVFTLLLLVGAGLPGLFYWVTINLPSPLLWKVPVRPLELIFAAGVAAATLCAAAVGCASLVGRARNLATLLWMPAAVGLALWFWRVNGDAGDSRAWIRLAHDPFVMGSEPLGRWSHHVAWRLLNLFGVGSSQDAVRASSLAAGVALFCGSQLLAPRALAIRDASLAACFLLLSPVSVVLYSLPETTPWAYAFTGIYLLAGLRYMRLAPERAPWMESILIMLAVWTHGMALFSTGAHAVLVLFWLSGRMGRSAPGADDSSSTGAENPTRRVDRKTVLQAAALCIVPFSALAVTMLGAYIFGTGLAESPWYGNARGGSDRVLWVAIGEPNSPMQYRFMGLRHLVDLVNLWMRSSPLAIVAPVAVFDLWRARRPEMLFLSAGLIGLVGFSLVWNADLGIRRDYDLMAMFGIPSQVLALYWIHERLEPRHRVITMVAISVASFACLLSPLLDFP